MGRKLPRLTRSHTQLKKNLKKKKHIKKEGWGWEWEWEWGMGEQCASMGISRELGWEYN